MNTQQKSKIEEIVTKLRGLCVGEPIPTHKISGNGGWESCERNMYQVSEILYKLKQTYYKKILDVFGDDSNDWIFITRTFVDSKPNWFSMLEDMRQEILLHTHPDKKQVNWLEPQGGNLNPNKDLISLIKRLGNELLLKTEKKKNGIFRRIPYWIYILTLFSAGLLTILSLLGWLEPIKVFVYKLFTHK